MKLLNRTFLVSVLLLFALVMGSSQVILAAPANQVDAPLSFAGTCNNLASPGTVCPAAPTAGFLRLAQSFGTNTFVGILRFSVNQPFTIDKARLSLALGNAGFCGAVGPGQALRVYSTTNDSDPPSRSALLIVVDNGSAAVPFPGTHAISPAYNHFTDSAFGLFAQHIESQNSGSASAGDGTVTLWIEATTPVGSLYVGGAGSPPLLNAYCGDGKGGSPVGPPVLQLADQAQPLTVELSSFHADSTDQPQNRPIYAGLGLAILAAAALLVAYRRRTLDSV